MQTASLIDISSLPEEVRISVQYEIEDALRRAKERAYWTKLLRDGTDNEIIAAAQDWFGKETPIVLAQTYDSIDPCQELIARFSQNSPRRPVAMRGARLVRISRHGNSHHLSANGWADCVLHRAVKMSRRTILNNDEYHVFVRSIQDRLRNKYHLTSAAFRYFPTDIGNTYGTYGRGRVKALIGGKFVTLSLGEWYNIKALQGIICKTDKLDERIAAARAHMRDRLAA